MTSAEGIRLVLVRHGESHWNAEQRWQGHDGTGLTERGRRQAEAVAAVVADRYADVTLLARSDLERVAETAAPLEDRLARPVVVDPRLRELDVGTWAGMTRAAIAEHDPDGFAAWERGDDVVIGGGERIGDLRRRVAAALHDLADRAARAGGGTAVVVTSGGCVRAAAATLLDLDGWAWQDLPGVANGSLTEFRYRAGRARLVRWAGTDHLDAAAEAATAGVPPPP